MPSLPVQNPNIIAAGGSMILNFQDTNKPYKAFLPLNSFKVINESIQTVQIYINTSLYDTIYGLGTDTISNVASIDIQQIVITNTGTGSIPINSITVALFNGNTTTDGSYSGSQLANEICNMISVNETPQNILSGDTAKSVFNLDAIINGYGTLTPGIHKVYLGKNSVYPMKFYNNSDLYSWPKIGETFIHDLSGYQVYCDSPFSNLCLNPSGAVDTSGWSQGANWALTRDTTVYHVSPASIKIHMTSPTGGDSWYALGTINGGDSFTYDFWMRSLNGIGRVRINQGSGINNVNVATSSQAGTWEHFAGSYTSISGTNALYVSLLSKTGALEDINISEVTVIKKLNASDTPQLGLIGSSRY